MGDAAAAAAATPPAGRTMSVVEDDRSATSKATRTGFIGAEAYYFQQLIKRDRVNTAITSTHHGQQRNRLMLCIWYKNGSTRAAARTAAGCINTKKQAANNNKTRGSADYYQAMAVSAQ